MTKEAPYNVAKRYVAIIDAMEKKHEPERLLELEEQRVIWHNKLLELIKREGIRFKDREHVTALAYRLIKDLE